MPLIRKKAQIYQSPPVGGSSVLMLVGARERSSRGTTTKDGNISIKVSSQGMTIMNMVVRIYDRKVEAVEDITTPAGTFSCYKMSSTIETKTMFSVVAKSVDWVARKVGPVRSETYDKDGKLASYMILTSLK